MRVSYGLHLGHAVSCQMIFKRPRCACSGLHPMLNVLQLQLMVIVCCGNVLALCSVGMAQC